LTEKILKELKLDVEELTLVPGKGGRFEVFVDDAQIYSKLETGEFPDEDVIVSQVVARSR
jgi:selenoprotein W-related protein